MRPWNSYNGKISTKFVAKFEEYLKTIMHLSLSNKKKMFSKKSL